MTGRNVRFLLLRWLLLLLLCLLSAAMDIAAASAKRGDFGCSSLAAKTTATGAESAAQGAMLRMQLGAEQVAGARLPQSLMGYTKHGLNQTISRDSVGVSPAVILDAFKNPTSIVGQTGKNGGAFQMTGQNTVIVVNPQGQIITTLGN